MTDFTNLAALVAQGQSLLDEIKGGKLAQIDASFLQKLVDVDAALAAKIAQANTDVANAVAPVESKFARIQLTKNQELLISSGSIPDDLTVSSSVSIELITQVSQNSSGRTGDASAMLGVMQADLLQQFADFDIRETGHYKTAWNICRVSWDFGVDFSGREWVAYVQSRQGAALPTSSGSAVAALVKLETGAVSGSWVDGCELGKWRFCSSTLEGGDFGGYSHVHPFAESQVGSMLVALPVATSGVIAHPHDLFKNIEI